jgi:hypothetical protein
MGEAIAAFSLAANIIQFVDFGGRLVSDAWSIHQKGRSGFGEILDLEKITEDLKLTLVDLISPLESSEDKTDSQRSLEELAEQCSQLVSEILSSLSKIGLSDKLRKRDALKAAFRLVWKEDEIKSQQMRLENIKHQLNLHILVSLRYTNSYNLDFSSLIILRSEQARKSLSQQELVLTQLSAIHQDTQRLKESASSLTAEGIGSSLLDFLTAKLNQGGKKAWQRELITAIYEDHKSDTAKDVSDLSVPSGRRKTLQSTIIARLRYPGMEDREGRIADAYEKTFQWIFDHPDVQTRPWSNLKVWLETDAPLYWITGKAGSGKSTLMKYICQVENAADYVESTNAFPNSQIGEDSSSRELPTDTTTKRQSRCEKYLKTWANDFQLVIATFFWNSGVKLQMSEKGLLFSLLFQILQQCPELIPSVCPNRWEALCLFNEDPREWTKQELEEMFRSAAKALSQEAKLALFVDGLDEFDGQHDDLISLFQDLIANNNIKVCVSSRPWVLFEDAFEHKPSLTLDALTYHDIKHYVASNLHGNSGFAQLRLREPTYAGQLVENVVSKASGVFLWVHLVVASLLAGMSYGDRVSDLQRRLDLLPPDLENLYNKILQSLDPFYLEHAAQLFKLVQASKEPPPLLLLSFADEDAVDFALKQPIQALSPDGLLLRAETMRRRVNSRCKGLLEVGRPATDLVELSEDTVQYLHRTVKDYIESTEVQAKLQSALKSPFDPYLRLCSGSIAHIKAIDDSIDFLANGTLWARVQRCLHSASRIQAKNKTHIAPLLDELDKAGEDLALKMAKHSQHLSFPETGRTKIINQLLAAGQWVPTHPMLSDPRFQIEFGCNFLSLVVRYGVVDYVQAKVNRGCLVQRISMKPPPLSRNLVRLYNQSKNNTTSYPTGIWPLLQDSVHPSTLWSIGFHDSVPSLEMIECLLNHGANPNHLFHDDDGKVWSVWKRLLPVLYDEFHGPVKLRSPWSDIARMMIKAGAEVHKDDIQALSPKNGGEPKLWKNLVSWHPKSYFTRSS